MTQNKNFIIYKQPPIINLDELLKSNKTNATYPKKDQKVNENAFISHKHLSLKLDQGNINDLKKTNDTKPEKFKNNINDPEETNDTKPEEFKNNINDPEETNDTNSSKPFQRKEIKIESKKISIDLEQTLSWQKLAQILHITFSTFYNLPTLPILSNFPLYDEFKKLLSFSDAISSDGKNVNKILLVPGNGFKDETTKTKEVAEATKPFQEEVKNLLKHIIPGYNPDSHCQRHLNNKKNSDNKGRVINK